MILFQGDVQRDGQWNMWHWMKDIQSIYKCDRVNNPFRYRVSFPLLQQAGSVGGDVVTLMRCSSTEEKKRCMVYVDFPAMQPPAAGVLDHESAWYHDEGQDELASGHMTMVTEEFRGRTEAAHQLRFWASRGS